MRINIDEGMLRDPRFTLLATLLGEDIRIVRDRTICVWFECTRAKSAAIPSAHVDIAAGREGFCAALVNVGLGRWVEPHLCRVAGVEERIRYLQDMQSRSRNGGVRSGEERRRRPLPLPNEADTEAHASADGSARFAQPEAHASDNGSTRFQKWNPLTLTPDLTLSPSPDLPPDQNQNSENPPHPPFEKGGSNPSPRKGSKRGAKGDVSPEASRIAATVLESLGGYSGVRYTVTPHHAKLIASRLASGLTVLDLRKVAWYAAEILGWSSNSEMRPYLRPETLYGPRTIERYIDAARSEYRKAFGTDDDVREPGTGEGEDSNGAKGTP